MRSSYGPSIKYVTLFLANFDPPHKQKIISISCIRGQATYRPSIKYVTLFLANFDPLTNRRLSAYRAYEVKLRAVHKVRHAIFGQFRPPYPLSHFVAHPGTPDF